MEYVMVVCKTLSEGPKMSYIYFQLDSVETGIEYHQLLGKITFCEGDSLQKAGIVPIVANKL